MTKGENFSLHHGPQRSTGALKAGREALAGIEAPRASPRSFYFGLRAQTLSPKSKAPAQ